MGHSALAQDVAETKSRRKLCRMETHPCWVLACAPKPIARVKVYSTPLTRRLHDRSKPRRPPRVVLGAGNWRLLEKSADEFPGRCEHEQIRDAFRDGLRGTGVNAEIWLSYFSDTRSGQACMIGQEYMIAWTPVWAYHGRDGGRQAGSQRQSSGRLRDIRPRGCGARDRILVPSRRLDQLHTPWAQVNESITEIGPTVTSEVFQLLNWNPRNSALHVLSV